MRRFQKFGLAVVAVVGLTGVAAAKVAAPHLMTVPLPDGSVVRVEYSGEIAPRVTVAPLAAPRVGYGAVLPMPVAMPPMDGLFGQFDRQMAAAMQQIGRLSRQTVASPGAEANVAAYGQLPAGTTSYSSVTVSENGRQCTRSTQVIGAGPGKPPRITTNVSGDCTGAITGRAAVPSGSIHRS